MNNLILTPNASAFVEACKSRKGQFIELTYKSNPKPAASFKERVLEKVSTGIFRTGINYANLSPVKEAIADGLRGEVQPLPKGQEWLVFPFVIKAEKGELLRITTSPAHRPSVVYKVDGVEVSKENFESFLIPSALKKPSAPLLVFTIKAENLIKVGGLDLTEEEVEQGA